jgi:hypothetical protein
MPFYNYKKDLPVAQATQREVAQLLEKLYSAEILEYDNDTNEYDIRAVIKGKECTFEVKEDFVGETTGNVGLEFECRGKASGIQTSKANYHIYKLHTMEHGIQFVIHTTVGLRRMVENCEYFRVVNGGDKGSNSMNYLFKYNIFVRTGKILPFNKE